MVIRVIETVLVLVVFFLAIRLFIDAIRRAPQIISRVPQKIERFFNKPKNVFYTIVVLMAFVAMINDHWRPGLFSLLILLFLIFWLRRWIRTNFRL